MPARPVRPALAALHARIALIEGDGGPARGTLPFGVPDLDRRLPSGGLALGCLHEVAGGGKDAAYGAAAACFAAGIAARLPGQVLWCVTQADLFALAPGLGLGTAVRPLRADDLEAADAAWLVSSARNAAPVRAVDGADRRIDADLSARINAALLAR